MSNSLYLLNAIGKSGLRKGCFRSILNNPFKKLHYNSNKFNTNSLKTQTNLKYVLTGSTLIGGFGYLSYKKSYDDEIDFIKSKIKEFLDNISNSFIVHCESNIKQNRTSHYEETIGVENKKDKSKKTTRSIGTSFLSYCIKKKFIS